MNKKNLILLLVLALLIAASAVYQYLWLPKTSPSGQQENWLAKVNFSEVDKIVVTREGKVTTLNKEGERWRVAGEGTWYVHDVLVENFTRGWQTSATFSMFIVSNNKDTKASFKTDGSFNLKLSAKNNQLIDLNLGSNRAGYTYVAKADSDASFEVGGDLRAPFDYEEWRDLSIFNTGQENIKQIKIVQGKNSLVLVKTKDLWEVAGNAKLKLNQNKVSRMASLMGDLSASSIPDQKTKDTGLDKNNWTVEATGEGIKNVLIIGQEKVQDKQPSGDLFVKSSASSNIYLLGKNLTGIFQINLKDLTN